MRIKKRLQLNTLIVLVMAILMALSLIWSLQEAFLMDRNKTLATEMQKVTIERALLRSEYQLYLSKHAKAQWYEKTLHLKGLLEQARTIFTNGADRALLQDIQKNFDGTVSIFSKIMEISEKRRNIDKDASPYIEGEKRLISQLLLKAHALNNGVNRLQESAHRASISAYKRSIFLFIVFMSIAIIITIVNSVVIQRLLTRHIEELRKGTKIIGAGNLDHIIRITGIDEFSDLAEAANEMAARLKELYTSVANLQREIAERRQAEGALRRSEERYRTTLMSIGDGVIVTDTTGLVQVLNPVAESLTGWASTEAHGKPLEEVFHIINEQTRQTMENPVRLIMERGMIVGLVNHTLLIAKDGTEWPIADSGAPIRDEEGKISGVVLVFRDQAAERAAQKRLRREMERAQQYLDTVGVVMVALDNQAKVTLINHKGCEVLGYAEQEIIGKNWFDCFLPEYDLHHVKDVFARIVAGQLDMDEYVENHVLTGSGEERLIAWHNTVLRDDDGTIIGTLSSGEDITARKLAEEAIRSSLHEKEILIREVHHRVKNNLQIICSLLILEMGSTREKDTDTVLMKISNRVRVMSLVHEKLYQSSDMAHISMKDYIHDLAGRLISAYEVRPDTIRLHIDVEDIPLSIDNAIPFGLILNELITNTIKHAFPIADSVERIADREGQGTERENVITVTLKEMAENNDYSLTNQGPDSTLSATRYPLIALTVSDNGIGLSPDLDIYTTDTLGLRLVRILGEGQLKGTVSIDRTQGTTFHITFPGGFHG